MCAHTLKDALRLRTSFFIAGLRQNLMRSHSNKVVDVRNKLRLYWLAMFGWQVARPGEWCPVDLTNSPRDVAHPLQHPSARGTKRAQKIVHLGLFIDVFPSKVSHLFHTQTPSNWIVNLWWRLIIWPASEVLMRSYFSWMTSPQITPGDSGLRVLTCFFFWAHLLLAGGIKLSALCFSRGRLWFQVR